VKLNVFVGSMRPLTTLPSPLDRLGNGVGEDPLGSGGKVGGAVPVVTVCGTVSPFVHVTVVPLATSMTFGLNAKPLMLIAMGCGDAVGLALGAVDAPAHPTRATTASRPRPSTRVAIRMTTSDDLGSFPHTPEDA
jgi:hypothetical protein